MAWTLADLAALVDGKLHGDGSTVIHGANPLGVAQAGEITLIDNTEKAQRLGTGNAAAAVCPSDYTPQHVPCIQVDDVHAAFAVLVTKFRPPLPRPQPGVDRHAIVSPTAHVDSTACVMAGAIVADQVHIGPGCVVHSGAQIMAGSRLERDVTLFPNVVLYENSHIGARVIIHAGAVIGAYGFGYKVVDGRHQLAAQLGHVEIHDDVEVGANTTIDRGAYGPTIIGAGTKIDNLVMIAHNCRLGKHNLICSQVGIAGSTTTGDYVVMAGQVGVRDHVHIGEHAVLGAKSGVPNDVPAGAQVLGIPAIPLREQKLRFAILARLPELRQQLKDLDAAVRELQKTQPGTNQAAA